MASVRKALAPLGLLVAVVALAGCPPAPRLSVTPLAISIFAQQDGSEFQIANVGGGSLNWTVTENIPWLTISRVQEGKQAATTLQGTLSSGIDGIEIQVDRTGLGPGTQSGEIQVISNGGSQVVKVSVVTAGPAQLQVSTNTITFGTSLAETQFSVLNGGSQPFDWSAKVDEASPWLSITPSVGQLDSAETADVVTVKASRDGLAAGSYSGSISVTSTAGDATIDVSMIVAPFAVTPAEITFGSVFTTSNRSLDIQNRAFDAYDLSVITSTVNGGNWLSASSGIVSLVSQGNATLGITANANGLQPGLYTGEVTLTRAAGSFVVTVPVSMQVSSFNVSTDLVEFGTISLQQSRAIQLTTIGGDSIGWRVPTASLPPWLSVTPTLGTVTASQDVTITVSPDLVEPGAYSAVIQFIHDQGTSEVTVSFARPRPASLMVEPKNIDLGTSKVSELIGIWNPGIGTVNWSIDTTGFPAWLTLTPVNGSGIASGSVTGSETDSVTVAVDRSLAPADQRDLNFTFNAIASGDSTTPVPITVTATTPLIPRLVVEAEGVDSNNVDFVNFDIDEDEQTFIVRNEGSGVLTWSVDLSNKPGWLAQMLPSQGNLEPNEEISVKVTVDRTTLSYLGAQQVFQIISNDPDRETYPLLVEVLVEKRVAITARPGAFAFGPSQTSDLLEVANDGDPDTVLNFQITASKEWLSVFPDTGSSVGTASSFKDFKPFSVTVDRSRLEGNGASGKLIINAFEIKDGERVPVEGVEPFEVPITVTAAELTLETTPAPYLRPPSVVRFPLMMRNIAYQILPLGQASLPAVESQFLVLENDIPLELTETNQRLKSGYGLRADVLLMLDYSGSMQASASGVDDLDIANAPDPLQALYQRVVPQLLDTIPSEMRVGIAVFNDRDPVSGTPLRYLFGGAAEPVNQQDDIFILDREALKDRLQSVVVNDNGATELYRTVLQAVNTLLYEDVNDSRYLADRSDFKALVCITDGRITTPPSPITEVIDALQGSRTRFYPLGWGNSISADPLVRLASASGGHFYSTQNQPTGAVDNFGTPIRKPLVSQLEGWCVDNVADECDQSIGRDFDSMTTFGYVSLNEEANTAISARLTFNDPNDQDSPCVEEQGLITGEATSLPVVMSALTADNRLGQISLRSNGVSGGVATVTARLEFTPRNLRSFSVQLTAFGANAINRNDLTLVSAPNGGVISNWTISGAGDIFTFTAPAAAGPLAFGEYGDIFNLRVSGASSATVLLAEVVDPLINADPEGKYFSIADSLPLTEDDATFAPALPSPEVTTDPPFALGPPWNVSLGPNEDLVEVFIRNIGGYHEPTEVGLFWEISTSLLLPESQDDITRGVLYGNNDVARIGFLVDRTLEPGRYTGAFSIDFTMNSIRLGASVPEVAVSWTISPPVLAVSSNFVTIPSGQNTAVFTVRNAGQSTLTFGIDPFALEDWIGVDINQGGLGPDLTSDITITVDRSLITPPAEDNVIDIRVEDLGNPSGFQVVSVFAEP